MRTHKTSYRGAAQTATSGSNTRSEAVSPLAVLQAERRDYVDLAPNDRPQT